MSTKKVSQATQWRRDNPEKAREITNKWYARNKAKRQAAIKRWKVKQYGITVEEFDAMIEAQHGACAICLRSFTEVDPPCIDHCHRTNTVRGVLCRPCNLSIGNARDCPTVLRLAANYLERNGRV